MHVPDGGDVGLTAGFNKQGKLVGLDPSDTVAQYFDSRGRQRLAVSNRVALCIPRFVIVTSAAAIANQIAATGPGATESVRVFAGAKRAADSGTFATFAAGKDRHQSEGERQSTIDGHRRDRSRR